MERRPMTPRTLFGPANGKPSTGHPYQRRLSLSSNSSSSFSSDRDSPTEPPTSSTPISPQKGNLATAMECKKCLRQGAPLFCFSCGFWMANGRVAQPCPKHPKVIFYTDFTMCPKCKQPGQLRELD